MNAPEFLKRLTAMALLGAVVGSSFAQEAERTGEPDSDPAALEPAVDVSAMPPASEPAEPAAPSAPRSNGVVDRLDLGTTSITGNQELPKVLYIVPWKRSDLGNLVGRPVNTLLDEVLAPVDPDVFERHLNYYDTLYGEREQE